MFFSYFLHSDDSADIASFFFPRRLLFPFWLPCLHKMLFVVKSKKKRRFTVNGKLLRYFLNVTLWREIKNFMIYLCCFSQRANLFHFARNFYIFFLLINIHCRNIDTVMLRKKLSCIIFSVDLFVGNIL